MTPTEPVTAHQRLATIILGRPVHTWISEQRAHGSSWRKIADDLRVATNGQVDISHEACRIWGEEVAA